MNRNPDFFTSGDPFTKLFIKRWHLSPLIATILLSLILFVPIFYGITVAHAWVSTNGRIGLLEDYGFFVPLITVPSTLLLFFWIPSGISNVISDLKANKVLIATNTELYNFLKSTDRIYSFWGWSLISFIFVSTFMLIFAIPEQRQFKTWQTATSFLFNYTVIFWWLIFWVGLLLIIRGIVLIWMINKLFRSFPIAVKILHPDGAGGLSSLSSFSVKIAYLIAIYGVSIVAVSLTHSYLTTGAFTGPSVNASTGIFLFVYVLIAPVAFFAPIGAARSAMRSAKNEFLLQISDQFEADTENVRKLITEDVERLQKGLQKLDQLQRLHNMVNHFPVWPFNTENILRFFSAISSPFVLWLLSVFVDFLKR